MFNKLNIPKLIISSIFLLSLFLTIPKVYTKESCLKSILSDLTKNVKISSKIYRGGLLKDLDPSLYKLFIKLQTNPKYTLNMAEEYLISANNFQGILHHWKNTNQFVKKLNKQFAILYRSEIRNNNKKTIIKILKALGKGLFPMYKSFSIKGKGRKILRKILLNSDYKLTPGELKYLERKKRLGDIRRFRSDVKNGFQKDFVRIHKIKKVGNYLTWTIALSSAAAGIVSNKYIPSNISFDGDNENGMSRYDEKVELIFLSPMPHSSIRLGGLVYNYGVLNIDRWDLKTFKETVGFGESVSGNHTRIELKLTKEEKKRLRRYLEDDVGKIYPLAIPFIDCVSQTNKAIKHAIGLDVPVIMDRSQSLSIAYYKIRKLLGDDRIGDIKFAHTKSVLREKSKDAAINILDTMFFLKVAGIMFVTTPFLDKYKLTIDPKTKEIK